MDESFFKIIINKGETIYSQLIQAAPFTTYHLGTALFAQLPFYGINTDFCPAGNEFSAATLVDLSPQLLQFPQEVQETLLPIPQKLSDKYDFFVKNNMASIFNPLEHYMEYAVMMGFTREDKPSLGIKISFGNSKDEELLTPKKKIGNYESFRGELFAYSTIIEDIINTLYSETRGFLLANPEYLPGDWRIPAIPETTLMDWKPKILPLKKKPSQLVH